MARELNKYQKAARVRARAIRRIKNLEVQLPKTSGSYTKKMIRGQIASLKSAVKKSYKGSGFSIEDATLEMTGFLGEPKLMKSGKLSKHYAIPKDLVFKQQISAASRGERSYISAKGNIGSFKVKMFYAATQRLWEGKSVKVRNELIKKYYKVDRLSDAFSIVMKREEVREALRLYKGGLRGVRGDVEFDEFETSPIFLALVRGIIR